MKKWYMVTKKNEIFRLKFLLQEYKLSMGNFTIGRSPSCHLTLEDPLVSRKHACITVLEDHAMLNDLSSRNGTLVDNEPIFENHRLQHFDHIRIGTNDLIFLEESRYPATKAKPVSASIACPSCGVPFPEDNESCLNCGSVLIPDDYCKHCRTPATKDDLYCSKCGTPLGRDDSTIPVEIGGESYGWSPKLIEEIIEAALLAKRYKQASRLIDGKVGEFERTSIGKDPDQNTLGTLSRFNLAVARGTKDPTRLKWVVDRWCRFLVPMPEQLLDDLWHTAKGWLDITPDLRDYLSGIEEKNKKSDDTVRFIKHLRRILEETH